MCPASFLVHEWPGSTLWQAGSCAHMLLWFIYRGPLAVVISDRLVVGYMCWPLSRTNFVATKVWISLTTSGDSWQTRTQSQRWPALDSYLVSLSQTRKRGVLTADWTLIYYYYLSSEVWILALSKSWQTRSSVCIHQTREQLSHSCLMKGGGVKFVRIFTLVWTQRCVCRAMGTVSNAGSTGIDVPPTSTPISLVLNQSSLV